MDTKCLYAELLGDHFESLPSLLRKFHRRGGRAIGAFDVQRGDLGLIASTVASRMGLPRAASMAKVRLEVHQSELSETWSRWFDARLMRTRQWTCSGLLVEQAGIIRIEFRVEPIEHGFTFQSVECRVLGIRLPRFFKPQVRASIMGDGDGWVVDVRIDDSRGRLVCRYGGRMRPE